jgi:hypothetical protein
MRAVDAANPAAKGMQAFRNRVMHALDPRPRPPLPWPADLAPGVMHRAGSRRHEAAVHRPDHRAPVSGCGFSGGRLGGGTARLAGRAGRSGAESAILVDVEGARKAAPPEKVRLLPAYAARGRVPGVSYVFGFLPRMVLAARRWRPTAVVQAVAGINTGWMWALARLLGVPFIYRSANDIDVDARISQRRACRSG